MPRTTATPKVGDPVIFEGLPHRITQVAYEGSPYHPRRDSQRTTTAEADRVFFESELPHTRPGRGRRPPRTRARFRTQANLADLRWSDELGAWYLWGRLLGAGRGAQVDAAGRVLIPAPTLDERKVVAELRDRGLLPMRATRQPGSVPAGGEHVNLHLALFSKGIDWAQELANVRRGEGLSENANAAIADYGERFRKRLTEGYADPDADDSKGEG